jgi:cytochrome c oxidase accessory protein FixG
MPSSQKPRKVIPIQPQAMFQAEPKVYPRSIEGVFQNWRWIMVWVTQIIFYGVCWLQWNGRQAVLFDLETQRFYLFDFVLWPQDTIYLALLLVLSALALFLFTAVAGRLWCGYTCPQTVYTEIFLWIEKKIEGERPQRMKLDAAPLSTGKATRKLVKHSIWIIFSLWTGLTFVGYFTPIRELTAGFFTPAVGPWDVFWVLFYAGFTYGFAGFLREQMCKYICPYARFQFVMFDADTLIITYDEARGEPRGGRSKNVKPGEVGLGDCIDCGICVQVCPTGIDIRDGLQAECIACAACIDACDQVMDRMQYPRGLIRYSTENAVKLHLSPAEIIRRAFRPRTLIYCIVFVALAVGTAWSLATRVPLRLDVERDRSVLSREVEGGKVENVYRLLISNASELPRTFEVSVAGITGIELDSPALISVPGAGSVEVNLRVHVEADAAPKGAQPIQLQVTDRDDPAVTASEKTKFWMP